MELINRLKKQYSENLPFVIYRKRNSALLRALLQKDNTLETTPEFEKSGFVMAPFSEGLPVVLIRPDEILEGEIESAGDPVSFGGFSADLSQQGKSEYVEKVQSALQAIESKQLQKVVLSRKISNNLKPNPFLTYQILLRQFPEAFCYLLYHPSIGIWMGASPETLLRYSNEQITTVSLAGTRKGGSLKDTTWGPKEYREQQYVTEFIEKAIDGLADPPELTGPETVKAGNLLHLKTLLKASNPRVGLAQFIKALHPTPAVCGIPAEKAKAYLLANEGYPRAYYTGFLGELNWGEKSESHLFVNLRCMKLGDDQVDIYVGGGLVKGSDPELEWLETVHKSQSMLHLLRNSTVGLG